MQNRSAIEWIARWTDALDRTDRRLHHRICFGGWPGIGQPMHPGQRALCDQRTQVADALEELDHLLHALLH